MRIHPRFLLFAVTVFAAASSAAASSKETLLESFRMVALGAEAFAADSGQSRTAVGILRWESEISWFIPADAARWLEGRIERHFALMREITGLRVRRARDPAVANFRVEVLSEPELQSRAATIRAKPASMRSFREGLQLDWARNPRKRCIFHVRTDRLRRIESASVFLSPDRGGESALRECIAEEITQAMGLINDDRRVADSIFNDWARRTELTASDRILLRLLYHPRLSTRMSPGEVMKAAGQVIEELLD